MKALDDAFNKLLALANSVTQECKLKLKEHFTNCMEILGNKGETLESYKKEQEFLENIVEEQQLSL